MRFKSAIYFFLGFTFLLYFTLPVFSQSIPFYKNGTYAENIPSPASYLGFEIGDRPARYHEIIGYLKTLEKASPKMKLVVSGKTHEGRNLYYALISSAENIDNLDKIKKEIGNLADPRKLKTSASAITKSSPAIAWMMYSIHGDEISGADASMQVVYQLVAGTDEKTQMLLQNLVIGVDPMENPDGRERYLAKMQQWRGEVPISDVQSVQHTGVWPWGRTNHYLFDLNRDWFILSQPESRARVSAFAEWHPQLVVDAHEMGSYSTYLFPPARAPLNPNFPKIHSTWGKKFSDDQANAFDNYGWSYYTRAWLEDWYPGYGSSMPYFRGAVAILYEQAQTDGSLIKRPDGTILTFREAIHHQFVSSIANLSTLAENRKAILDDFYQTKKTAIATRNKVRTYYILPGKNATRAERLMERLTHQGIQIDVATASFKASGLQSYWDKKVVTKTLPKGTFIVQANQPLQPLIQAILEFDPRMSTAFLQSERESVAKGNGTRLYEVSAWSMPMAYGLEAYQSSTATSAKHSEYHQPKVAEGKLHNPAPQYGFVLKYEDDNAIKALLALLEKGVKVLAASKDFTVDGQVFSKGSLLMRNVENNSSLSKTLAEVCQKFSVDAYGVNTARSKSGPDLGGGTFSLLEMPKTAILTGNNISSYNFGAMWYLLDYEHQLKCSVIEQHSFGRTDLRKYNVLILPSSGQYEKVLGKSGIKKIKTWVKNGGTVIAIGNAAAFMADSASGLSQVKLRRQALKKLPEYQLAFQKQQNISKIKVDSLAVWESKLTDKKGADTKKPTVPTALEDSELRTYFPRGPILNVQLDKSHWLSNGIGDRVPAIFYSSYAYLSKRPVQTVGSFADKNNMRLSGLLWKEAKYRWENTAYLTREASGNGQIILFAGEPNFRSYFYGTARLLLNAVILGPGLGANQAVAW